MASGRVWLAKVFCLPVGMDRQKPLMKTSSARSAASPFPRLCRSMSTLMVAYRYMVAEENSIVPHHARTGVLLLGAALLIIFRHLGPIQAGGPR